jgi:hypothetical protein
MGSYERSVKLKTEKRIRQKKEVSYLFKSSRVREKLRLVCHITTTLILDDLLEDYN